MNVEDMIIDVKERSNDIDVIATIKNVFDNFYNEDFKYSFLQEFNYGMPWHDLTWNIKKYQEDYVLECVDELLIEEINKNLPIGILLYVANVEIKNGKCYIHSTKDYSYTFNELNIPKDEFPNEFDNHYDNSAYCISFKKEKDNIQIEFLWDCISCLRPLFYSLDDLTEDGANPENSFSNPIVKMVIKAIYESIIFK